MKSYPPETAYFCLFLVSLWLVGTIFEELARCRLLGELLVGMLFGNLGVGTLLPSDKTAIILCGEIGILAIIFDAGMATELGRIRKAALRGTLIAVIGTVVPVATGFGFVYALLKTNALPGASIRERGSIVVEALASGAALGSTSIACAVSLMKNKRLLETPVGTLITTAAMIDDVISLVLLGIVASIGASKSDSGTTTDIGAMTVLQPILASLGIIFVGLLGCTTIVKFVARRTRNQVVELQDFAEVALEGGASNGHKDLNRECGDSGTRREQVASGYIKKQARLFHRAFAPSIKLAAMVLVGIGYSILAEYLGSSRLLGAFVAGVFFSPLTSFTQVYKEQVTDTLLPALSAVFFATIGFAIPLTKIFSPILFGWGFLYTVIASLSKLITCLLVPISNKSVSRAVDDQRPRAKERWLVGTAMIARGELGLLMVQQALLQGVLSEAAMVVTTWSIILCTLVGVSALSFVMRTR